MIAAVQSKVIPYRYYNVIRNCGDAISAYILQGSFGVQGVVVGGGQPHLLPVGSIFFMATAQSHIWGSGILNPAWPVPAIDPGKIRALRGTHTRDHLRGLGMAVPDVPLGDPGILVDRCIDRAAYPTRYRAAIVPHHAAWHSKKFDVFRTSDEFCLVDMMDDSLKPLELIAASDVVISQSLHGLVFAEALGKPSLWISDQTAPGWTFKFHDWFSTTANPQREPAPLNTPPHEMIRRAELRSATISQPDLLAAFPMELVRDGPAAGRPDIAAMRAASPATVTVDHPLALTADAAQDARVAFAGRLQKAHKAAFSAVPEPTYLAILAQSASSTPTRADLLEGQRYLDVNRTADFLVYPSHPDAAAKPGIEASPAPLGEAAFDARAIMLRPAAHISLKSGFAMFHGVRPGRSSP